MKIWNTYEEILADIMADKPKPKPPPAVTPAGKARERFTEENQPDVAVFDSATRGNDAAIKRAETMEDRRGKQMAKEYAEHAAEGSAWHALAFWRQSMERAQERLRELDGEDPQTGNYDPVRRFQREMEG